MFAIVFPCDRCAQYCATRQTCNMDQVVKFSFVNIAIANERYYQSFYAHSFSGAASALCFQSIDFRLKMHTYFSDVTLLCSPNVAVNVHLESRAGLCFLPVTSIHRPNNRTFEIVPSRLGFSPINKRFTLAAHLSCRPGFRLSCVTLILWSHVVHYYDYPGKYRSFGASEEKGTKRKQ